MSRIDNLKALFNRERDVVAAYHAVFDTDSHFSKKVVLDLMRFTNMLQPTFSPNESSESLAYEEGKRAVMLYILSRLQTSPEELYNKMMEASKEGVSNE